MDQIQSAGPSVQKETMLSSGSSLEVKFTTRIQQGVCELDENFARETLTGVRSAELYVCRAPEIDIVVRIDQQNSREPKS